MKTAPLPRMITFLSSLCLLLFLAPPALAKGENGAQSQLGVLPSVGATGGSHGAGLDLGILASYRYQLLELGVEGRLGAWYPGNSYLSGAALLGTHLGDRWSLRALAAMGVHGYQNVGAQNYDSDSSTDPGVSATLPFVGARLVGGHSFGDRTRFFLGLTALLDYDIGTVSKKSEYMSGGLPREKTYEVGQLLGGGMLTIGMEFEIGTRHSYR